MHEKDEYLIFTGGTFPNLFDWDADIEFTIGKGEEAETYQINAPTIIRIPAGIWHCPLNFKRVDKPVFFQAALMMGCFGGTYDTPRASMRFTTTAPSSASGAEKKCNTCKKCLTADWQKK